MKNTKHEIKSHNNFFMWDVVYVKFVGNTHKKRQKKYLSKNL